jgi:hypothetical protein
VTALALSERPSARKPRETDAAWSEARGDAPSDRVPEAARRSTRIFRRSLEPMASAINAVLAEGRWKDVAADVLFKARIGRARAFEKLKRLFHGATINVQRVAPLGEVVTIWWLEPMGPVAQIHADEPGFSQDAIVARGMAIVNFLGRAVSTSLLAAEFPDHTTARMFQRTGDRIDGARVLNEATSVFLGLPARRVIELGLMRETLVLPGGDDGRFLSNVIFGRRKGGGWYVYGRPRTFVTTLMAGANQHPIAPASDPGSSMLSASLALSGKLSGVSSPLTVRELSILDGGFEADALAQQDIEKDNDNDTR